MIDDADELGWKRLFVLLVVAIVSAFVALALGTFVMGCGDSFAAAAGVDAGPTPPDSTSTPDVTGHDASSETDAAAADVDAGIDAGVDAAGDGGRDVHADTRPGDGDGATCTPMAAYTEPATCACFFAGSCPYVDGGRSRECIWAETPLMVTGQPTCRGCGLIAFPPNPCNRCKETFSCACLAPYLDPGQRCCDGPGGPYLSDYACP